MKPEDPGSQGKGHGGGPPAGAKGQDKVWNVTGTDPVTGLPLPPRTVTTRQWREEKLGQQGYVKPDDLDESAEGSEG
jgi:hypothetical protein